MNGLTTPSFSKFLTPKVHMHVLVGTSSDSLFVRIVAHKNCSESFGYLFRIIEFKIQATWPQSPKILW